jgi:hypothetical protein
MRPANWLLSISHEKTSRFLAGFENQAFDFKGWFDLSRGK